MLNDSETVECQISNAAMDELAGVRGTLSTARQAQFLPHRDAIEKIASDLFDTTPSIKSAAVRIFTKEIPKYEGATSGNAIQTHEAPCERGLI
jgi:hypothetical protein